MEQFHTELMNDPLIRNVWERKYRWTLPDGTVMDKTPQDTCTRVTNAIFAREHKSLLRPMQELMQAGYFIPGGRILAGAGTDRRVTLLNCYVMGTMQDSMPGIQRSISLNALTMQQGGGTGTDFTPIRPAGALVRRTGAIASGVIPFMDQQDGMCKSIASAGERRGAMMGTLADDHPDLWNPEQFETHRNHEGDYILKRPSFISAKRQKGRLTQFNISVLISDAFMRAVANGEMWELGHFVPPADGSHLAVHNRFFPYNEIDYDNEFTANTTNMRTRGLIVEWYVYRRVPARQIWEDIMRSNYVYAEPGVIFIDRVNERNNLRYCEDIRCVNPCGEQPLPPNGCCCLGSANMARMVLNPFTPEARFDWDTFARTIRYGVRFLDNVLDVAVYPLWAQRLESIQKRRIGLGITGFADALIQLGIRYGSDRSIAFALQAGEFLRVTSYDASISLAQERGSFPDFNADYFLDSPNVSNLPEHIREKIKEVGIRNGVLNTIAPNGTISMFVGNTASGHEPVYSFSRTMRTVRQADGSLAVFDSVNYTRRLYEYLQNSGKNVQLDPDVYVGAEDLTAAEHLALHAAWQQNIDASISKTINCNTEMSFDEFQAIYTRAFELGCKGCTTYRYDPESGRGAVLSTDKSSEPKPAEPAPEMITVDLGAFSGEIGDYVREARAKLQKEMSALLAQPHTLAARPEILHGRTHKLKWVPTGENWYITVTNDGSRLIELFITTREVRNQEWITALSRLVTALLRHQVDVNFLVRELKEVYASTQGMFLDQKYCPSIIAAIGRILERETEALGKEAPTETKAENGTSAKKESQPFTTGLTCPSCKAPTWIRHDGCWHCGSCGHSTCE